MLTPVYHSAGVVFSKLTKLHRGTPVMAFSGKHESVRVIGLVAMSCLLGPVALAQQSLPVNPNASQAGQSSSEAVLQKEMVPEDARELLLAAAQVNGLE